MQLTMPDSLYLIASDDDTGAQLASEGFQYAMSVAVLFELTLRNRINLSHDEIAVQDATPTEDPLLDLSLERIANKRKVRSFEYWVGKLCKTTSAQEMRSRLTAAGDLREEERPFLLFFKSKKYPSTATSRERERINKLKDSAFHPDRCSARDAMLLSLLQALKLLDVVFADDELSKYADEMQSITQGDAYADVVGNLVERDQALAIAATATLVVTTT